MTKKKYWFLIGKLGWMPCTWQGWAVLALFIGLMYPTLSIPDKTKSRLYGGCLSASVIMVAMMKTKPRSAQK